MWKIGRNGEVHLRAWEYSRVCLIIPIDSTVAAFENLINDDPTLICFKYFIRGSMPVSGAEGFVPFGMLTSGQVWYH